MDKLAPAGKKINEEDYETIQKMISAQNKLSSSANNPLENTDQLSTFDSRQHRGQLVNVNSLPSLDSDEYMVNNKQSELSILNTNALNVGGLKSSKPPIRHRAGVGAQRGVGMKNLFNIKATPQLSLNNSNSISN